MREYAVCEACGRRTYGKTRNAAIADADEARELVARLVRRHGSVRAAALEFAKRHDVKPQTAMKRLYRLTNGQRGLYNPNLIDELEVML